MSRFLLIGLILALCATLALADAGRGRHKRVYVVPTPGKVTVDAKLDDWDLSGRIWIYVQQETAEMGSAHYAMMYDAEALYISGEVRDPSPMLNRYDPKVNPELAWSADVCQIFLSLDPALGYPIKFSSLQGSEEMFNNSPVGTLYLWYYTDRQEPSLAFFRGMRFTKPARPELGANGAIDPRHFQAAYRKTDDGQGFLFEYRIPWTTLGMKTTPKAGDLLAGVVCVFWSDSTGLKTGGAGWAYDVMATPGFPWQETGTWGKIILSEKGHLPRAVVEEDVAPEKPLPLTFPFTMPRDGETSIALLDADGRPIRHVVTQGQFKGGPTTVRWDGMDDAGKPLAAGTYRWQGIHHAPITTKFLLSVHNSGQPPYKKEDGTGGWGADHSHPTGVCASGDDMFLLWAGGESGWGLIRTDLQGKKRWGINHGGVDVASDGKQVYLLEGHAVVIRGYGDGRTLNFGNGKPKLDPPAGDGDARATGIAYAAGSLYVAYGGRNLVGIYAVPAGTLTGTWGVPAPGRLTVHADGRLLAISQGQVVVVGKDGVTALITTNLEAPVSLSTDAQGLIYVANRGTLQNVSVYDAAGNYLRSLGKAGGRPRLGRYEAGGMLEPGGIAVDKLGRLWVAETLDSPRRHSVWDTRNGRLVKDYFGGSEYSTGVTMDPRHPDEVYCHNVLWQVDLDKGTWAPKSTLWRGEDPNMPGVPGTIAGTGPPFHVFTATNGKQYAWSLTPPTLWRREGDTLRPLLQTFHLFHGTRYPALQEFQKKNGNHNSRFWQDTNRDMKVQFDEFGASKMQQFRWVDADLNLYASSGQRLKPVRIERDGTPVYDFSAPEKLPIGSGSDIWVDPHDRSLYTVGVKGTGIARWSPEGTLLWNCPKVTGWHGSLNLPPAKPGEIWGVTDPLGVAGEITGVMTYFGPVNLFTRDGLFVAQIMNGKQGWVDRLLCESFYGNLVRLANGRTLLLAGDQDGRVTEVLGLETIKRFDGAYTLTETEVTAAASAKADYERQKALAKPLNIVRGKAQLAQAPTVGKAVDATRAFRARAAYDETHLYLQYEIDSPAELVNAHPDPQTLFRGGNCLDLQLATDPAADPKRKTPAPGDLRLLVTRQEKKPVAVLYRPKVKGVAGEPIVLISPVAKESFDAIEVVSEKVGLEYKARTGGFTATVTVPLALLGWQPQPGTTVRLDLGYIFGVPTGNLTERRGYWSNNGFAANVVNDIPHESRLEPAEWGTAAVE
jgi:hypothetical protein